MNELKENMIKSIKNMISIKNRFLRDEAILNTTKLANIDVNSFKRN